VVATRFLPLDFTASKNKRYRLVKSDEALFIDKHDTIGITVKANSNVCSVIFQKFIRSN